MSARRLAPKSIVYAHAPRRCLRIDTDLVPSIQDECAEIDRDLLDDPDQIDEDDDDLGDD